MMQDLLLHAFDEDDQAESETICSKALHAKSFPVKRCYGDKMLGDISIEEGDEIAKEISENGLELEEIWEKHKLKPNIVTINFPNEWKRMREILVCEREGKEINWDELFPDVLGNDADEVWTNDDDSCETDDEDDMWGDNAEKPESLRIIAEWKHQPKW